MERGLKKLLDRLFYREDIGGPDDPYLTRWTLLKAFGFRVYLHWFRRSDADRCLHDHPCSVISLMFRGSYLETCENAQSKTLETTRFRAPYLRFFKAEHSHRVTLEPGMENKTWTVCLFFPKKRAWGFWIGGRWMHWIDYHHLYGGSGGCGDRNSE